jgi:arylsulfatase A-like enzyme
MRILHVDIDTLRPDHLGCYGYHRNSSPNIDRLAAEGVRFDNCYVSDAPCLPSRAAFVSGRFGIRNGAINHGGGAADIYIDPAERQFRCLQDHFMVGMRAAGLYPVSFSSFGERHSAFWFYNGFREMNNSGGGGVECANEVIPDALDWLDRKGADEDWYLHVNIWDPHTPYNVPEDYDNPFKEDPPPAWMTEEIRRRTWDTYGPGSAQEPGGMYTDPGWSAPWRHRQPEQIESMESYRKWVDGYDCGVRYADDAVGQLVERLEKLDLMEDTLIFVTSDHGENLGELSVYGDHQTADQITNRVPLIVRHPEGIWGRGRVDTAFRYQFDWAATLLDFMGQSVPESWDGRSFLPALNQQDTSVGRDHLILSNCTWACQRAVRWKDYILIHSDHTGFKNYPDNMLFNVNEDPHELNDLAEQIPDTAAEGLAMLESWTTEQLKVSPLDHDPMTTVLNEGGPFHASYQSVKYEKYLERLRETGREGFADELDQRRCKHEESMG